MKIEMEERGKAVIVKLEGDLDYNSYLGFNDKIGEKIDNGKTPIVIDLSSVAHIDSMGLGAVTKLWKTAESAGSSFVLASIPKNVGKLIKLINLDQRIKTFDSVDEALA